MDCFLCFPFAAFLCILLVYLYAFFLSARGRRALQNQMLFFAFCLLVFVSCEGNGRWFKTITCCVEVEVLWRLFSLFSKTHEMRIALPFFLFVGRNRNRTPSLLCLYADGHYILQRRKSVLSQSTTTGRKEEDTLVTASARLFVFSSFALAPPSGKFGSSLGKGSLLQPQALSLVNCWSRKLIQAVFSIVLLCPLIVLLSFYFFSHPLQLLKYSKLRVLPQLILERGKQKKDPNKPSLSLVTVHFDS